MKRTQIYLDEKQDASLARRARSTGRTKSDLIREAVHAYLSEPGDEESRLKAFRAAVRATAGTIPRLPEGRRYVEDLRSSDAERQRDIEAHLDR